MEDMSRFLYVLENEVQIVALIFMGSVYILRLFWMFRYKAGKEISHAVGNPQIGAAYSLMNIAMPWSMESVRKGWGFYTQLSIDTTTSSIPALRRRIERF